MAKEKIKKVGFTMYPKDWWSSETFFNVDDLTHRYLYLEMMFIIYSEGGLWAENIDYFCKRLRYVLDAETWDLLRSLFDVQKLADGRTYWTHEGISSRLGISPAQVIANRTNGSRNGKPIETQSGTQIEPNRDPIYKRNGTQIEPISGSLELELKESKVKRKETKPVKVLVSIDVSANGAKGYDQTRLPLWGAALKEGPIPKGDTMFDYGKRLQDALDADMIPPDKAAFTFLFFYPIKIEGKAAESISNFFDSLDPISKNEKLHSLAGNLKHWYRLTKLGKPTAYIHEGIKKIGLVLGMP